MVEIPGLGVVVDDRGCLVTGPRHVPILGGECRFVIDGFDPQEDSRGLVACIEHFCALDRSQLEGASGSVFEYYEDVAREVGTSEPDFPVIPGPDQVWNHVQLTDAPWIQRETPDGPWSVVLENECAWDREHGLMVVLREGRRVTKVGPFDGHLTHRHAFGDDSIPERAVYWSPSAQR